MRNYRFVLEDIKVKVGADIGPLTMGGLGLVLTDGKTLKDVLLQARSWMAEHKITKISVEKDKVILENSSCVYECYVEKERFEDLSDHDLHEIKAELIYEL